MLSLFGLGESPLAMLTEGVLFVTALQSLSKILELSEGHSGGGS